MSGPPVGYLIARCMVVRVRSCCGAIVFLAFSELASSILFDVELGLSYCPFREVFLDEEGGFLWVGRISF
jgi:hypothetical protein